MQHLGRFETVGADNWGSLVAAPSGSGYSVSEVGGKSQKTSRVEMIMRFVGVVFVLSSLVQWAVPEADFIGGPMVSKSLLSFSLALLGMAIYRLAMQVQRAQISYDPHKGELLVSSFAHGDRQMGTRRVPLSQIKSIYVRRADTPTGKASLRIRLLNSPNEITALRGDLSEIQIVHGLLCRDLRAGGIYAA